MAELGIYFTFGVCRSAAWFQKLLPAAISLQKILISVNTYYYKYFLISQCKEYIIYRIYKKIWYTELIVWLVETVARYIFFYLPDVFGQPEDAALQGGLLVDLYGQLGLFIVAERKLVSARDKQQSAVVSVECDAHLPIWILFKIKCFSAPRSSM